MRVYHLNLLVLSAGLLVLLANSRTTAAAPQADVDVQQLTLADVNQAAEQQEQPAVRLARQFGFGGGRGGFGRGRGGFGGGRRGGGGFCCGGGGFRRPGFGGGFYPPPPPPPPFFGGPFFG
ncbi:neuropeptide-like protein 32 [Drosophila takahashii]|uniref:neuropeptide-like protein 32 n=1 Tax=Drosophila takahashii TaxID=29030 RepID=UPI001CF8ADAE|nr:neuropeptide-like protein 32 [Drosophila takahashii]